MGGSSGVGNVSGVVWVRGRADLVGTRSSFASNIGPISHELRNAVVGDAHRRFSDQYREKDIVFSKD